MKFSLKVYCEKTRLKEIRTFVEEKLQNYTTDEIEINQLILAVDEVCANFIIHSNDCNASEAIYLDVYANETGVTFEISDKGSEFDLSKYKEPTLEQVIKEKRKGGIGLMLVNRIMDKVEFFTVEKNNKCILHKNFNKH
jgi:serine/threonine-protein kinase RsbW